MVARSSTEAEYRSLAFAATDVAWFESLFTELALPVEKPPVIWCDNISANLLASNPVYHQRTKHIEIDIHYVRDRVLAKELDVRFVSSEEQVADVFTKALSIPQHTFLRDKLHITDASLPSPESELRGAIDVT